MASAHESAPAAARLQGLLDKQSAELITLKIESSRSHAENQMQMAKALRGLNRAEDDAEDLRKKTGALRGENEALSDDKDALVHLQAGLQEERDELERDNSALRDELSALRAGTGSNNGQQLDALGDENENLRRALREKSQELEASELVERSARRDLGAKDFERDNLAFENEKLHKKVSKLKREMDRLRDKLEDPPAHSNRRERLDISALLWISHPGSGKYMRACRGFAPGDIPTGHAPSEQLTLTPNEIVHVNVGGARAPDGMVKASRLNDEDEQGFVPFSALADLSDDEQAQVRAVVRRQTLTRSQQQRSPQPGPDAGPAHPRRDSATERVAQVHGPLSASSSDLMPQSTPRHPRGGAQHLQNDAYVPVERGHLSPPAQQGHGHPMSITRDLVDGAIDFHSVTPTPQKKGKERRKSPTKRSK